MPFASWAGEQKSIQPALWHRHFPSDRAQQLQEHVEIVCLVHTSSAADPVGLITNTPIVECRHDDDGNPGSTRPQIALKVQARHSSQVIVEQETGGLTSRRRVEKRLGRAVGCGLEAASAKHPPECSQCGGIVLDNDDQRAGFISSHAAQNTDRPRRGAIVSWCYRTLPIGVIPRSEDMRTRSAIESACIFSRTRWR